MDTAAIFIKRSSFIIRLNCNNIYSYSILYFVIIVLEAGELLMIKFKFLFTLTLVFTSTVASAGCLDHSNELSNLKVIKKSLAAELLPHSPKCTGPIQINKNADSNDSTLIIGGNVIAQNLNGNSSPLNALKAKCEENSKSNLELNSNSSPETLEKLKALWNCDGFISTTVTFTDGGTYFYVASAMVKYGGYQGILNEGDELTESIRSFCDSNQN